MDTTEVKHPIVRKALKEIKVMCYLDSCDEKAEIMTVGELANHASLNHLRCPNYCEYVGTFSEKDLRFHMGNDCIQ